MLPYPLHREETEADRGEVTQGCTAGHIPEHTAFSQGTGLGRCHGTHKCRFGVRPTWVQRA